MDIVQDLITYIVHSTSPYHTVRYGMEELAQGGFNELSWGKPWMLAPGGRYFTRVFGSALFAFTVGMKKQRGLRIAAAHTDFPGLRVKPVAGVVKGGCGLANVEPYGGLIERTWLDRPLSLSGQIVLKGKTAFTPEAYIVDLRRPLMTIPSLAIHMDRKVNDGQKINRQEELQPICALAAQELKESFFLEKLAREVGKKPEEIISYDLNLYPIETGCTLGFDAELVSSPRLDNLTSVKACLDGIIEGSMEEGIHIAAFFDNEEVGSRTKQGAGSAILPQLIDRIYRGLEIDADDMAEDISGGFLLSCDVAHGAHPNYLGKADPTNRPLLGKGLVLKTACSQSYAGDATAQAVVIELCRAHGIPFQRYANRSDIPGGATLGSIASAMLGMRAMDIGVPILAMHSARETMGAADQEAMTQLLRAFFTDK